jgi:hypothetical protein
MHAEIMCSHAELHLFMKANLTSAAAALQNIDYSGLCSFGLESRFITDQHKQTQSDVAADSGRKKQGSKTLLISYLTNVARHRR